MNAFNLYAYCSNNPVMYVDPTGNIGVGVIALIALAVTTVFTTIGEVIAYNTAEQVYEQYQDVITIENEVVYNSNEVKNPFHIWALSSYVRYYTDSGAKGSSYGLFVEWISHNVGDSVGLSGGENLNFGKTVLSDFKNHNSFPEIIFPIIMNGVELVTNPIIYIYDVARTIL